MAIRFTQSPLMTLSENINLEKNELENLISFKFEFYTLFFVLYFIGDIFHLCKKLRGVRCIKIQPVQIFESSIKLV